MIGSYNNINIYSDAYANWRFDGQDYPIYVPITDDATVTSPAALIFHKSRSVLEKFKNTKLYSQTKWKKDLKAWWLAFQKQNKYFQDINTGRYSGQLINTYWKPSNSKNSAIGELVFNGSTSYANCGQVDSGKFFTIACWVKFGSLSGTDHVIISNANSTETNAQYDLRYETSTGRIVGKYINNSLVRKVYSSGFSFSVGVWYHIVWVNSDNSDAGQSLYVNGVKLATTSS